VHRSASLIEIDLLYGVSNKQEHPIEILKSSLNQTLRWNKIPNYLDGFLCTAFLQSYLFLKLVKACLHLIDSAGSELVHLFICSCADVLIKKLYRKGAKTR
jgi:hypothetical protein